MPVQLAVHGKILGCTQGWPLSKVSNQRAHQCGLSARCLEKNIDPSLSAASQNKLQVPIRILHAFLHRAIKTLIAEEPATRRRGERGQGMEAGFSLLSKQPPADGVTPEHPPRQFCTSFESRHCSRRHFKELYPKPAPSLCGDRWL